MPPAPVTSTCTAHCRFDPAHNQCFASVLKPAALHGCAATFCGVLPHGRCCLAVLLRVPESCLRQNRSTAGEPRDRISTTG